MVAVLRRLGGTKDLRALLITLTLLEVPSARMNASPAPAAAKEVWLLRFFEAPTGAVRQQSSAPPLNAAARSVCVGGSAWVLNHSCRVVMSFSGWQGGRTGNFATSDCWFDSAACSLVENDLSTTSWSCALEGSAHRSAAS